jgi:hypothetical protein
MEMKFRVVLPKGDDGMSRRECPVEECLGQFMIQFGTGLNGEDLPCHCPYCGHISAHETFHTPEQIEYARSVALNQLTSQFLPELKRLEFNHPPRGAFGIGVRMRVTGTPTPIRPYRDAQLETIVVCHKCTLRYAIYGVFAFCPDCGTHNSRQILDKNLDVVAKQLAWSETVESELAEHLIGDALENAVSAFDGFGRELCRLARAKATAPTQAERWSFQNIIAARDRIRQLFGFDFAAATAPSHWDVIVKGFQKRHLFAHKMGIVDEVYVKATGDATAVVGRKVPLSRKEVADLASVLRALGEQLHDRLTEQKKA